MLLLEVGCRSIHPRSREGGDLRRAVYSVLETGGSAVSGNVLFLRVSVYSAVCEERVGLVAAEKGAG